VKFFDPNNSTKKKIPPDDVIDDLKENSKTKLSEALVKFGKMI
jgi:hypothetical protein